MTATNPLYRLETFFDAIPVGANTILVIWADYQEPIEELFGTGGIDIIFVLGKPPVSGHREVDHMPEEYEHIVPVAIMALTSDNVFLAEVQMKVYLENYRDQHIASGEYFILVGAGRTSNIKIGQRVIYRTTYNVRYRES